MVAAIPILLATRSEFLKVNTGFVTCDRHGQVSKSLVNTIELGPDTATGMLESELLPTPSCADHKASKKHRKPAHPTSLLPPFTPPRNTPAPARFCHYPNTVSLQMFPQSHTCVPANASFSSKLSKITSTQLTPHTPNSTNTTHHNIATAHHTPNAHKNIAHTTRSST
jgi:hypothetical protein